MIRGVASDITAACILYLYQVYYTADIIKTPHTFRTVGLWELWDCGDVS